MNFINAFYEMENKFRSEIIFQKEGNVFREKIIRKEDFFLETKYTYIYIYTFVNYVIFVIIYAKQRNVTNALHEFVSKRSIDE